MTNNIYLKNSINLPIERRYNIKNSEDRNLNLTVGLNNNISFFKYLSPNPGHISNISVFKFEVSEIELFSGLRFEKKKIIYSLQLRLLNMQFKDDALANNGKKIDFYNPLKFRFAIHKNL